MQEGQGAAADGGHGGGAVGLEDLGDDADGVGEGFLGREDRLEGAAGQVAVADLAAAGAEPARLADGEGREVVVEHEALAPVALDVVEDLLVEDGAEGGDGQGLGLAAGEEGRAVGAGQDADLAGDGADVLEAAAVDAHALVEDGAAEDLVLEVLHEGVEELLLDARRRGRRRTSSLVSATTAATAA